MIIVADKDLWYFVTMATWLLYGQIVCTIIIYQYKIMFVALLISFQLILGQGAMENEGSWEEAPDTECQTSGGSRSSSQGNTKKEGGANYGTEWIPGLI